MQYISEDIPLNINDVITAMRTRQDAQNTGGCILNDCNSYDILTEFFKYIQQSKYIYDYTYSGILYRRHLTLDREPTTDEISEYTIKTYSTTGDTYYFPKTRNDDRVVSFSTSPNYFSKPHYKYLSAPAVFMKLDTKTCKGININKFYKHFGLTNRFDYENEVLFPMWTRNIIREYICTPRQFNYYQRSHYIQ